MKANCCLLLLLGSPLALSQGAAPPLDIADPASFGTKGACLTQCEQVFSDCKAQCENSRTTVRERQLEETDLPVGDCLSECEENLGLCKEDC
ncbi:MAG: hypothetical protein LJE70_17275 [Chromatiaceae bacterium]|jgi:hypothetical protein|nr:hypothetical protein [Chromatiaceae bacterium]